MIVSEKLLNFFTNSKTIALVSTVMLTMLTPVAQAANLVKNGDFELENTSFNSNYIFTQSNTTEEEYTITTNPIFFNSNYSLFGDHTTGMGKMMVVNGSRFSNTIVWQQTLNTVANTNYDFSAWVASTFSDSPAELIFKINNIQIGSSFAAPINTGIWEQFKTTWNSGSNTSATISIINQNLNFAGNDFALDDISLTAVTTVTAVPEPSMILSIGVMAGLGELIRRKNPRSV